MNHLSMQILILVTLCAGCGTVVGNPKKPKDDPKSDAIVFKLPELDLTVPGGAKEDDAASFALAQDDALDNGDKTLLTAWGKRLDQSLARINGLSQRVNKILEKKEDDVLDGVLVFKNRGEDNQVSGRIQTLPEGGEHGFEAVLCYGGQLLSHLKWSESGEHFEMTRDFGAKSAGDDEGFTLVSTLKLRKTDRLVLDIASQGTVDDLAGADGASFTESSHIERDAAGFRLRSVADQREGTELPDDGTYEGDRYLVGQVTDSGSEFAGYFKGFKLPCKNGFDEAADDLWQPGAGRPRFCVGRPLAEKRFKSVAQYYETLARLEPIGIQPKAELRAVKFADGLSCE